MLTKGGTGSSCLFISGFPILHTHTHMLAAHSSETRASDMPLAVWSAFSFFGSGKQSTQPQLRVHHPAAPVTGSATAKVRSTPSRSLHKRTIMMACSLHVNEPRQKSTGQTRSSKNPDAFAIPSKHGV